MFEHLTDSALFDLVPCVGGKIASSLEQQASATAASDGADRDMSVVVRAMNEAGPLERLLSSVRAQKFAGEVELVVVDNESSDWTAGVARDFGATVVTIARNDFTHPRSMNMGMDAASYGTVLLTVGHALLTNDQMLRTASRQLQQDNVAATYGPVLPNANASRTERAVSVIAATYLQPARIKKAGMGVLGATNAVLSKEIWRELGRFDERYECGGEDTHLAADILAAGHMIARHPLVSTHHSHGVGFYNYAKQARQWAQTLRGPQQFDRERYAKRRPDLNFD